MTCWPKIAGLFFLPFLIIADAGPKPAEAQGKLDAYYTATLLGLPIGHISWTVDLKESRFSSVARGSIVGLLRLFWPTKDQSWRKAAYLTAGRSHRSFN